MQTKEDKYLPILKKPYADECVKFGKVTHYDNKEGKTYGFFITEEGESVFFHAKRGYALKLANDSNKLMLSTIDFTVDSVMITPPKVGDDILAISKDFGKGQSAVRWINCSDQIIETLEKQKDEMPLYEVIEKRGDGLQIGSAKVLLRTRKVSKIKKQFGDREITETFYILDHKGERIDPR